MEKPVEKKLKHKKENKTHGIMHSFNCQLHRFHRQREAFLKSALQVCYSNQAQALRLRPPSCQVVHRPLRLRGASPSSPCFLFLQSRSPVSGSPLKSSSGAALSQVSNPPNYHMQFVSDYICMRFLFDAGEGLVWVGG